MMQRYFVLLVLSMILLITACQEQVPLPPISGPASPTVDQTPTIPRTTSPSDTPTDTIFQDPGELPSRNDPVLLPNTTIKAVLLIPLGESIGKNYPQITEREFGLLKHPPIRVNNNAVLGYREVISFGLRNKTGIINTTGVISFSMDEDTDEIGTFLSFAEREPLFEYRLTLDRGTFHDIQGRDIQILGHTYIIAEATNFSVLLYGRNVESSLMFVNGSPISVNGSRQSNTLVKVTPNSIAYELFVPRDVLLSPGEHLAKNIGQKKFASALWDIVYEDLIFNASQCRNKTLCDQLITRISFKQSDTVYNLYAEFPTGTHKVPLTEFESGKLYLGRKDERLHMMPCQGYCIAPDDLLALTTTAGVTYVLTYAGASEKPNQVIFRDQASNRYSFDYTGTPGKDASATLLFGGASFRAKIGPRDNTTKDYNISIEGPSALLDRVVFRDGSYLKVLSQTSTAITFDIISPRTPYRAEQHLAIKIFEKNGELFSQVENMTFYQEDPDDTSIGQTSYGTLVQLRDAKIVENEGTDVTVLLPSTRAYGRVVLETPLLQALTNDGTWVQK